MGKGYRPFPIAIVKAIPRGILKMRIQKKIIINALPEMMWPFLVEPDKILKWCFTLESFAYTSAQEGGEGSTFSYEEKGSVHRLSIDCVITEWDKGHKISFKMIKGAHFKHYEETWSIEAAQGGSIFSFEQEIKLPYGVIGNLMGIFSARRAAAVVDEMLAKLKEYVEGPTVLAK